MRLCPNRERMALSLLLARTPVVQQNYSKYLWLRLQISKNTTNNMRKSHQIFLAFAGTEPVLSENTYNRATFRGMWRISIGVRMSSATSGAYWSSSRRSFCFLNWKEWQNTWNKLLSVAFRMKTKVLPRPTWPHLSRRISCPLPTPLTFWVQIWWAYQALLLPGLSLHLTWNNLFSYPGELHVDLSKIISFSARHIHPHLDWVKSPHYAHCFIALFTVITFLKMYVTNMWFPH